MGAAATNRLSLEEYLVREEQAFFRSEYFNGEVFAMAGGTPLHARLCARMITLLNNALAGTTCEAYTSDLRYYIAAANTIAYPDLSVVCGPPQFHGKSKSEITNPVLLAEVISASSDGWDQLGKFALYKQLPTLREYLIVYQHAHLVEHHARQEGGAWVTTVAEGLEAEVTLLLHPGAKLSLAALYADLTLDLDAIGRAHGKGMEGREAAEPA
ncbi:MAG: Uma2 family endonuclease [Bryobacter sp.]|nr:Uma2 family endonuclease [Bryobacter sp.]